MKNDNNMPDLSKDILSPKETWILASNLNSIEAERERQKNPTSFDYLFRLLVEIAVFPGIIYAAYEFLCQASSAVEFILIIGAALFALWIDAVLIRFSFNMLR